jgi:hypothetical protein
LARFQVLICVIFLICLFFLALALPVDAKWIKQSPRTVAAQVMSKAKRKRIRRVVHRRPPIAYAVSDVVEAMTYAEFWAAERAKMKAMAAWCVGVAVR